MVTFIQAVGVILNYMTDVDLIYSRCAAAMPHTSPPETLKFHLIYSRLCLNVSSHHPAFIRVRFRNKPFNLPTIHPFYHHVRRFSPRTRCSPASRCLQTNQHFYSYSSTASVCPQAWSGTVYDGLWWVWLCVGVGGWGMPPSGAAVITHYIRT